MVSTKLFTCCTVNRVFDHRFSVLKWGVAFSIVRSVRFELLVEMYLDFGKTSYAKSTCSLL